jgi:hypothetical protein
MCFVQALNRDVRIEDLTAVFIVSLSSLFDDVKANSAPAIFFLDIDRILSKIMAGLNLSASAFPDAITG